MASGRIAIGIDVGGSGIKAAVVDIDAGRFRSERLRVRDAHSPRRPRPSSPRSAGSSGVWPRRAGISDPAPRSGSGCPA